jgi:predicted phosphohydrolase
MAVYVIADLHLSTADSQKSMEVFGNRWKNYIKKIQNNWNKVIAPEDTVVIAGDISWGLCTDDALSDLHWLDSLAGKKILLKGNHDFWWSTVTKLNNFFELHGIKSIELLNNNAIEVEDYIIAGSRGWFTDKSMQNAEENVDYNKIVNRESIRLDMSLTQAKKMQELSGKEILAFMHFPPVWSGFVCVPLLSVLKKHNITKCYFGHIHGSYSQPSYFEHEGIRFYMISADFLDFLPRIV